MQAAATHAYSAPKKKKSDRHELVKLWSSPEPRSLGMVWRLLTRDVSLMGPLLFVTRSTVNFSTLAQLVF